LSNRLLETGISAAMGSPRPSTGCRCRVRRSSSPP